MTLKKHKRIYDGASLLPLMPATQFSSPEATTITSFFGILNILLDVLYKYKQIYSYFLSFFSLTKTQR